MSIIKFNTAAPGAAQTKSGGGTTLLVLAGLAILGWLGYEHWYKPMKEEEAKKASETKA